MAMYNGKGPNYCKNCGVAHVQHRISNNTCPNLGGNQTGLSHPDPWLTSTFDPQEWGKKEPADMDRLPLSQEIRIEERTLFDDYYIAAIQSVTMNIGDINLSGDGDIHTAARVLAFFAKELAVQAIRNRELYLYGEYKE